MSYFADRPTLLGRRLDRKIEKLLLVSWYDPSGISTVKETIANIQRYSEYEIIPLNLFEHRPDSGYLKIPSYINLSDYKGIIIHNTVSYSVLNLQELDSLINPNFTQFEGVKILMKQDENHNFREISQWIAKVSFDIVLTCLPNEEISKIYPDVSRDTTKFIRMLTGYVTPKLRNLKSSDSDRPIDIGYRGSIQPLNFGRLAYEKRTIGEDVKLKLRNSGLKLDISSRWEDRIGGQSWFDFLMSCKATLGAASGASVFDLDGNLEVICRQAEADLGPYRDDPFYCEQFLSRIEHLEYNVNYQQLSPRHFEAAAAKCMQILFKGEYSDVLQLGTHYFELNRDLSNLDEAVEILLDNNKRKEFTERAYSDIIETKTYWIEEFVKNIDIEIKNVIEIKNLNQKSNYNSWPADTNILLVAPHEPTLDPRLHWIESQVPTSMVVHQIGSVGGLKSDIIKTTKRGGLLYSVTRDLCSDADLDQIGKMIGTKEDACICLNELRQLNRLSSLSHEDLASYFGAPVGHERIPDFSWYLHYIVSTAYTLVKKASEIRNIDAIIATDFGALIPSIILKDLFGVPVLYDAHEYWPEMDVRALEFEAEFWRSIEKRISKLTDSRVTVSNGIAKIMSEDYGNSYDIVPNCEPLSSRLEFKERGQQSGRIRFLFQGSFSAGRGIELLIDAWELTSNNAHLYLRGPNNEFKSQMEALALGTGLLNDRIWFLDAVREDELVAAASEFDVGIIPYRKAGINYTNCSPNKTSQYMAAGIPILANDTLFVSSIINDSKAGIVCKFENSQELVNTVNLFASDSKLRNEMGNNGNQYFEKTYNWNKVSEPIYNSLIRLVKENRKNIENRNTFTRKGISLYKNVSL